MTTARSSQRLPRGARVVDGFVERVHDAAARLVWRRLSKPGNTRESRQTYDEWLASGEPFDANAEELED